MATLKGTNGLSLNIQHDYITLKTPNGNYTSSWGGAKASGKLAQDGKAFSAIDKYVQTKIKGSNYGDVMKTLLNPTVLSSLWPDWNQKVEDNTFLPNDKVKFNQPMFIKKYPNGGVVTKVARKYVFIRLTDKNEVIGFDYNILVKQ